MPTWQGGLGEVDGPPIHAPDDDALPAAGTVARLAQAAGPVGRRSTGTPAGGRGTPAAAGKTLEIDLFDPGDVGDKAWLQIYSPDGGVYTPATFSWTADSYASSGHTSGTNVTCIQTFGNSSGITPPAGCPNDTSGGQFFQNSWIQIMTVLPAGYGSAGLTPTGEPAAGWWKVKYTVNKGNDTTTWMVSIRGNPVHLVVP